MKEPFSGDARAAFFHLKGLNFRREGEAKQYLEFLRLPEMSMGLYVLEAGATDLQQPHTEDEVYVIMAGKAKLRLGEGNTEEYGDVERGHIVFVKANEPHQFFDIEERLETLVFFAPAEYTNQRKV